MSSSLQEVEINLDSPLPAQVEFFNSDARVTAFIGGIGSGKTFAGAIDTLRKEAGTIGLIVAPTYPMLRDGSMMTFFENFGSTVVDHNVQQNITTLCNGSRLLWRSGDDPSRLRGVNVHFAWMDEADYCTEEAYNVVVGRIRRKGNTGIKLTTTGNARSGWIRKKILPKVREGDENFKIVTSTTFDNFYLPDDFKIAIADAYTSEHARQELYGELIELGGIIMQASWVREAVEECTEYIVGVDLAISLKDTADDTAIVVVGKPQNGYHVADLHFGKWTFAETQRHIVAMATKWEAKKICVENVAYQEAMVQELRANSNHWIEGVSPKGRDKLTRFMPVAGKYEHGLITHSPNLPTKFTDQLTSFTGDPKNHDDMVDALVYAVAGFDQKKYIYS